MAAQLHERSAVALAAFQLFPPSIRQSLSLDPDFLNSYGLRADAQISFHNSGVSVQRSNLFNRIRELFADTSAKTTLEDAAGQEWLLEALEINNERRVVLSNAKSRLVLSDFSALSPDQAERLNGFNNVSTEVHLPPQVMSGWREILADRALTDDEIVALHRDIEETPIQQATIVRSEIEKGKSSVSTLVPRSEQYFDRLVGRCDLSQNIAEYAHGTAQDHIRQLMSWSDYDGFLLALLLSSHSSIWSKIAVDQIEASKLIQAYEWLQKKGDMISRVGAIEIGLSIVDKQPQLEPYIHSMIAQIRDENADDDTSRFRLLSALIVLIEGELARTRILREKPPFWRRLASIAHASLVERCIINSQVDVAEFSKWALETRAQLFYLQTMADLRREPRWHPDYISSQHLKAEFIGRILNSAHRNATKIQNNMMRELLIGDGSESLQRFIVFPLTFLPGPLEGGLISQMEPPADILTEIEKQLTQDILEPQSFVGLVNSALVFRLDSDQARLAAQALRSAKYHLRRTDNKGNLISILRGLATVAAVTRSDELAKELKILTRRCRQGTGNSLSAEDAMWMGLIAAASYSGLTDWCEFVGDWVTELAFQSLQSDEMKRLHFHVEKLCHIVPELWQTCGNAEAALSI